MRAAHGLSETPTMGWTKGRRSADEPVPAKINMHVGCMGLAPSSHDSVDSIPPMPTGGNLDDKRIGKGTTMYYPVEVAGALLSMGDAHAAQGDGELDGTAIETSITGKFKITVHKKASFSLPWQPILDFPLGETRTRGSSTASRSPTTSRSSPPTRATSTRTRTSTWRCTTRTRRRASS